MRIIECSVPTIGTYLVGNLLAQIGFENAYLHLGSMGSNDYNYAKMTQTPPNPDAFRNRCSLTRGIQILLAAWDMKKESCWCLTTLEEKEQNLEPPQGTALLFPLWM